MFITNPWYSGGREEGRMRERGEEGKKKEREGRKREEEEEKEGKNIRGWKEGGKED